MAKYVKTEQGYQEIEAIKFKFGPFKPAGKSYLTFSSLSSFTLKVNDITKHWNGTLEYFASDKTWTVWHGTTTLSAIADDGEYVLYLRGTGNTVITGNSSNYRWVLIGTDIKCIGNIENLLDYATVESGGHPRMAVNCYYSMFQGCTALTQAPALPATTLAGSCYSSMFGGCTSLTQAPALPATTLTDSCYIMMFRGCTSLKLSSTKTDEYTQEYRIPSYGNGVTELSSLYDMFASTGGTFTGTPDINTTYYLSSDNMIVRETEIDTLNGYVGSMINNKVNVENGQYAITTAGDGAAYTATVPGITSLTAGVSFIMIPHVVSTSTMPTLNVNGLGAKNIKRRLTSLATAAQPGYTAAWLAQGLPFRVIYDGTQWIAEGHDKPAGADLYGAATKATADADGNVITDTYATITALQDMLPKISTITLGTTWEGTGPYYQDVALSYVTEEYIVDLQPSVEQIVSWQENGYAFTTLSGTGSVRVYAIGNSPSESISIQTKAQKVMIVS